MENEIARFVVTRAADMTAKCRREIADWLRLTADNLETEGDQYAPKFVARYYALVADSGQKELFDGQEQVA